MGTCASEVQPEVQYVDTWPTKKSEPNIALSVEDNSESEEEDKEILDVVEIETETQIIDRANEYDNIVNSALVCDNSNQSTLSTILADTRDDHSGDEYEISPKPPLVMDFGSSTVKGGVSCDDFPRAVFPALVGRPKQRQCMMQGKNVYIGDEAIRHRGILSLTYPIERGVIDCCGDIELLWKHIFDNLLQVEPEEHSVLVTEPLFNPKANREQVAQLLFEIFNVPSMYMAEQPVLSLYACGRTTGIVLDSGYILERSTEGGH